MIAYVLLLAALMGKPVEAIQGEWRISDMKVQEPGTDTWLRFLYIGEEARPRWHVRGSWIEVPVGSTDKTVVKRLSADPNAWPVDGPAGVRFIDWDGVVYTGSYALKGDRLTLKLIGNAPVKDKANTVGTKQMIITLERPKPVPPK